MIEAAHKQKLCYDQRAISHSFKTGDAVWLASPTAGKLDPKWEGDWDVRPVNGPTMYTISDGKQIRIVHVKWLQLQLQPQR